MRRLADILLAFGIGVLVGAVMTQRDENEPIEWKDITYTMPEPHVMDVNSASCAALLQRGWDNAEEDAAWEYL